MCGAAPNRTDVLSLEAHLISVEVVGPLELAAAGITCDGDVEQRHPQGEVGADGKRQQHETAPCGGLQHARSFLGKRPWRANNGLSGPLAMLARQQADLTRTG